MQEFDASRGTLSRHGMTALTVHLQDGSTNGVNLYAMIKNMGFVLSNINKLTIAFQGPYELVSSNTIYTRTIFF